MTIATDKLNMHKLTRNWYKTKVGRYVKQSLEEKINELIEDVFGLYALELGVVTGGESLLQQCRVKSCYSISLEHQARHCVLQADYDFLPVVFDNIDLVVASHILEASERPHQVLREIDRVLVPEGHCIMVGFNAYRHTSWGRFAKQLNGENQQLHFYHPRQVKEWFSVLGFEIQHIETLGFHSNGLLARLDQRSTWLESWGKKLMPYHGSVYLIHAQKQVASTITKQKRWRPQLLPGGMVAPQTSGALSKASQRSHNLTRVK